MFGLPLFWRGNEGEVDFGRRGGEAFFFASLKGEGTRMTGIGGMGTDCFFASLKGVATNDTNFHE